MGIVFAFFLRTVIDAAVSGNEHDFYLYLALGSGIIVAEVVLYWLATYYKEKPAAVLARNIRHATFEQLLKRSYPDISKVHTGEWMTRINSDGVIIANAITQIPDKQNEVSGLMITGIFGGTVFPLVMGFMSDRFGQAGAIIVMAVGVLFLLTYLRSIKN